MQAISRPSRLPSMSQRSRARHWTKVSANCSSRDPARRQSERRGNSGRFEAVQSCMVWRHPQLLQATRAFQLSTRLTLSQLARFHRQVVCFPAYSKPLRDPVTHHVGTTESLLPTMSCRVSSSISVLMKSEVKAINSCGIFPYFVSRTPCSERNQYQFMSSITRVRDLAALWRLFVVVILFGRPLLLVACFGRSSRRTSHAFGA